MDKKSYKIRDNFEQNENQPTDSDYVANFPNDLRINQPTKRKRTHKFVWLLAIISVAIIFLGFRYLYRGIRESVGYEVPEFIQNQLEFEENQAKTLAELKESDTDQDGLTDYQELYQYHTSMFLPDTDSDAYSDYEEANMGEDPLCPRGQNCNLLRLITPQTRLSEIVQEVNLDEELTLQEAVLVEFRKFLLENGVTQEELNKLSDADLVLMLEAIERSEIISADELSATTTPEQIRAFLLAQPGANAEEVNSLSEQELIGIRDRLLTQ